MFIKFPLLNFEPAATANHEGMAIRIEFKTQWWDAAVSPRSDAAQRLYINSFFTCGIPRRKPRAQLFPLYPLCGRLSIERLRDR
jgi:hypothetical protein